MTCSLSRAVVLALVATVAPPSAIRARAADPASAYIAPRVSAAISAPAVRTPVTGAPPVGPPIRRQPANTAPAGPPGSGFAVGQFPPTLWFALDDQRWYKWGGGTNGRRSFSRYDVVCYGGDTLWAATYLVAFFGQGANQMLRLTASADPERVVFYQGAQGVRAAPGDRCAIRQESGLVYPDTP